MAAHIKTVAFLGVGTIAVDVRVRMAGQNCVNANHDSEALYKLGAPDTAGQSLLDRIVDTKKLRERDFNRIFEC